MCVFSLQTNETHADLTFTEFMSTFLLNYNSASLPSWHSCKQKFNMKWCFFIATLSARSNDRHVKLLVFFLSLSVFSSARLSYSSHWCDALYTNDDLVGTVESGWFSFLDVFCTANWKIKNIKRRPSLNVLFFLLDHLTECGLVTFRWSLQFKRKSFSGNDEKWEIKWAWKYNCILCTIR